MEFFKRPAKSIFPWFIFVAIVLLELIAFFLPSFGAIGMHLWLMALVFFASTAIYATYCFLKNFSVNKIYVIFAWLLMIFLIIFYAVKPSNISFETTQEAACSINLWSNSVDKGFHQSCFLGYPSRQYLFLALPSMIFGPSLLALNFGGSLYFLFSMVLWGVGLFKYLEKRNSEAGFFAGLSLMILLHFHYFNHFLFYCFEQSQFPLSVSLAFWGVYLWRLAEQKSWQVPILGLLMIFMAQMYTPAIAFLLLATCLLVSLYFQKKMKLWELLTIIVGVSISFGLTFIHRYDVRLTGESNRSITFLLEQGWSLLKHLFWKTQGLQGYSSFFGKLTLALAVFSGIVLKSKKMFLLTAWSFAVLFVATVAQGYSYYGLDFRVHRSLVVLPTVILLVILFLARLNEKNQKRVKLRPFFSKLLQWIFFLIIAISGIVYANNYLSTLTISPHFQLIQTLKSEVHQIQNKEEIIFTTKANAQFISLNDSIQYFLPNLNKKVLEPELMNDVSVDEGILVLDTQDKKFLPENLQIHDRLIIDFSQQPLYILY